MKPFSVHAIWDDDAGVWVASSKDVRGLVAEAATREELVAMLKARIPELLELNDQPLPEGEIRFRLKSEQVSTEVICD
ncbi:DUF1902 domain-containing protein [Chromobacterium piscinae]|uniref:DUF1902 domain-containing protein n=1 Tax=Chromobacterium piscinae TaxID=686831 RepID=A0ABV0H7R0_9NEIS|nr:DUF1902 domain-containing protein [Chromobacterium piscinae]MBX9348568.1 DUF1902 domain-containing protein [Chromobacterium vaccinii]MCD4504901.1 DUF1902 domain-containing protein [Chromobacterium piscinae]MCD5327705.1 DUF1902 domain-containing protein [Chromobacterium piscinae]NHQ81251.1 DUF1902 domain-containing protein [Chromobacterium vaccinii]